MIEKFEDLLGHTLSEVKRDGDEIHFTLKDGDTYKLFHSQDCCEHVWIEDINGDLNDLVGSTILQAEEVTSGRVQDEEWGTTSQWTFYKMATFNGYVTIRFNGSSNGYYSTSVDFEKVNEWEK